MKNSEWMLLMLSWVQWPHAAGRALASLLCSGFCQQQVGKCPAPHSDSLSKCRCGWVESKTLSLSPFPFENGYNLINTGEPTGTEVESSNFKEELRNLQLPGESLLTHLLHCVMKSTSQSPKVKTLNASPLSLRWAYPPELDIKAFSKQP